ncbi:hypothetical protein [Rhizobacter sp. P5_C2]
MSLSFEAFLAMLAIAVFLPFFLRMYRTSGMMDFVNIDREFSRYREGGFVAAETTILFSDKRVDRFAPSKFVEIGAPYVAVYVCKDERGQHWLWKLYRPTEARPTLRKLMPQEAKEMLQRRSMLLSDLCPKQAGPVATAALPAKAKRISFWDR